MDLLLTAYQVEVESRNKTFIQDEQVNKILTHVCDILITESSKFGIMFCGLCGNGKTTMIYALQTANNYLIKEDILNKDFGVRIMNARELIIMRSQNYLDFVKVKDCDVLAIDDLGTEPSEVLDYGNFISPIVELLEYRYLKQRFTIITTNMTPQNIQAKYGKRISDRFNEMMQVLVFENGSYRV